MDIVTSLEGETVMHYFESCKLIAYPDPASPLFAALKRAGIDPYNLADGVPDGYQAASGAPWTIGWGDTHNVQPGETITQEEADQRFSDRLEREFEPGVRAMMTREPEQGQFDAFVCLGYNIGLGNLKGSTAMRCFNAGDDDGAKAGILMWDKAQGRHLLGLKRRRVGECVLYDGESAAEAIRAAQAIV